MTQHTTHNTQLSDLDIAVRAHKHDAPHLEHTIQDITASRINRLREIRRTSRQLGYVLDLPQGYNNYDIDQAASELSTIIEMYNKGVGI